MYQMATIMLQPQKGLSYCNLFTTFCNYQHGTKCCIERTESSKKICTFFIIVGQGGNEDMFVKLCTQYVVFSVMLKIFRVWLKAYSTDQIKW